MAFAKMIYPFLFAVLVTMAATAQTVNDSTYTWRKAAADGTGKFYLGREIAQVMDASGSNWLERDTRQQEENAEMAITKMRLRWGMSVADIGAGTGYYSFRMAAKMKKGRLYAVEIQDELIDYLNNKKKQLGDSVIIPLKGSEQSPKLPLNSIDLAVMVDVYHELSYPHEMLQALRAALTAEGKIVLIEYRGEDPAVPIKALHKTTVSQINRELSANGFTLFYQGEFLPMQHFLVYKKIKNKRT